jgi:hypothetical protein
VEAVETPRGTAQSVKDRWVYVLRPDARREEILRVKDGRADT